VSLAYDRLGVAGLAAFTIPPAFMMLSVKQYLDRTKKSVEDIRRANTDLNDLLRFSSGLAAFAHDAQQLRAFAERELGELAAGPAELLLDSGLPGALPLTAGGKTIGWLRIAPSGDGAERWPRLRETVMLNLATALESALLVERVLKSNRDLVAALSRSMAAKDYYTGGHTERVSTIAVALARRLGYSGDELDAVEIGALLHDIGKIGVPEQILHKPGPLDDEEWKVMKEHPIISEFILSEVDLHPIVTQIARSSHERIDGRGYPDSLAGDQVPVPARIVLVADAWDALTSDRPYRRACRPPEALAEVQAHAGTQFCPTVVAALEQLYRDEPEQLASADPPIVEAA
jgi:putative nucleotidyltransferase with HDIG domain